MPSLIITKVVRSESKHLAALTAEERGTIEDFIEPYLMQIGLLERTPRGRKVTPKAYQHLNKSQTLNKNQSALI